MKDTAPDGPHSRAHEREGLHVKPETKLGHGPVRRGVGGVSRQAEDGEPGQPQSWATQGSC